MTRRRDPELETTDPPTSYLDHNATSPLLDVAREALIEALDTVIGNPSSAHQDGVRARALLDRSRARIAAAIGASRPDQIVFTSGGTESNNLAILGAAGRMPGSARLVTTSIEHPSVLRVFEHLGRGGRPILVVDPDRDGRVPIDRILDAVRGAPPGLISLQLANHET
ncbi:MAG: aminotransferase class V-fold PLP-dependent enzyme, partial [Myxococcales bacterium]|nr:aminotransferase class V-fold PLP-dependent enzyme [Myxococcales bacterium]